MEFISSYVSKSINPDGTIDFTSDEMGVWQKLYNRQQQILPGRACDEFLQGLKLLQLDSNTIPQLKNISQILKKTTNWQVAPVAALIPARNFFELLADRRFPAATFIRRLEELDYVKEPDIFHEIFGHCPMLTEPMFAKFIEEYAKRVLTMPEKDWALLQRFFWFTVEFGLIQSQKGVRAYGGGILSSISETAYSVESTIPKRLPFDPLTMLRTPYRIDMLQTVYFVIDSYQQLYDFLKEDLSSLIASARQLGEFAPTFPVDPNNPSLHINAC